MTNEEAIKGLKTIRTIHNGNYAEHIKMAIKALEQHPCKDCISREAVIKHICESKECYKDECKGRLYKRCFDLQWIYDLSSVTPQPKIGCWKEKSLYEVFCDNCGFHFDVMKNEFIDKMNYCPNCGAKMTESEGAKE